MRFRSPSTQRVSPQILTCILALLAAVTPAVASALQQSSTLPSPAAAAAPQDTSTYTLHVYANLMEVPTLVLSPHLSPVPPISLNQFEISLDSGPEFHPTQLQIEGNQPITLAILLDFSGDAHNLQYALVRSLPSFAAHSLHPNDRLSIYSVAGICISSAENIPSTDANRIASALDLILHPSHQKGAAHKPLQCGKSVQLWNATASVAKSIATKPSHRVILIISDGQDHNSTIHWQALRQFCASNSIAVFGLTPAARRMPDPGVWMKLQADSFSSFTQLTGGIVLYAYPMIVQQQLNHFIELVRGRYILDFPSPDKSSPGIHSIEVRVGDTDDFVRPAGIAFAPTDPALLSAPTTVAAPPSPATFGDRKVLSPPQ